MAGQQPHNGRGKDLPATAQRTKASIGIYSHGDVEEPVVGVPTMKVPDPRGGTCLSTDSPRSFEFPVVKSRSQGASGGGGEDQGGLLEDTSSSKLPKRSGISTPGASRLRGVATPPLRSADEGGAGPSEPPSKRPHLPYSSALKASDLPDYNRILDGDWSELSTTELMGVILTESCKVVNRKLSSLRPRPRHEALMLMKGRLDRAYMRGSMVIEAFEDQPEEVYLPPQAAYAVDSLQDGSAYLDDEIRALTALEAILDNPKEREVLLRRMGLGEVQQSKSLGKAAKGKARNKSPVKARGSPAKGKGVQGGIAGDGGAGAGSDKLYDTLKLAFEVLQHEAERTEGIVDKCNNLLETVTAAGPPEVPLAGSAPGGPAPTTPRTMMLNLAKAVQDE